MTQDHTPTPWRIGDAGLTVFGPLTENPSPVTVARCRTKADARLIRTAPEMLAALQWIAQEIAWGHDMRASAAVARTAIAQASGGKV